MLKSTRVSDNSASDKQERLSPCTLQGYEIIKKLGEGGNGVVLEANCPATGNSVAIKISLGDDASAATLKVPAPFLRLKR